MRTIKMRIAVIVIFTLFICTLTPTSTRTTNFLEKPESVSDTLSGESPPVKLRKGEALVFKRQALLIK